jgi:outer membrane protein assembly factor BamB
MEEWAVSLRRGGCPSDRLGSSPAVHLRRRATDAFRAAYPTDLVYVGTWYETCAGSTTGNRVSAFNAVTGVETWSFNQIGFVQMDGVAGIVLDGARQTEVQSDRRTFTRWQQGDTLFVTTERRASVTQHSVWAIDVSTEGLRWSANHGRFLASPALSPLHADRI